MRPLDEVFFANVTRVRIVADDKHKLMINKRPFSSFLSEGKNYKYYEKT